MVPLELPRHHPSISARTTRADRETQMGSDSEQYKDVAPAKAASFSGSVEALSDAVDMLASIGYEAADPSLFSPQWRESLQGLSHKRDLR